MFLCEGLLSRGIAGGQGLPWCEEKRLESLRGRPDNFFNVVQLELDGGITLNSLVIRNGQKSPWVEGLRNIRVLSTPLDSKVSLTLGNKSILCDSHNTKDKILWLRNCFEEPDDIYFYLDRSFKVDPPEALLVADEVLLKDHSYRYKRVERPYHIHPLPPNHTTLEGIMSCEICMEGYGNPSPEKLKDRIGFPPNLNDLMGSLE